MNGALITRTPRMTYAAPKQRVTCSRGIGHSDVALRKVFPSTYASSTLKYTVLCCRRWHSGSCSRPTLSPTRRLFRAHLAQAPCRVLPAAANFRILHFTTIDNRHIIATLPPKVLPEISTPQIFCQQPTNNLSSFPSYRHFRGCGHATHP